MIGTDDMTVTTPLSRISRAVAGGLGAVLALGMAVASTSPALAETGELAAAPAPLPELEFGDDASPWQEILVDGEDVQRGADGKPFNTFGGFGAVSCNNTSNLLLDYKEENPAAYWKIMRLIFDEETGAGLRHIKVELGSDTNTSSGAEPATKRSADEPANVLRGAGFHFIADALTINPDIAVEALRWGEPSWTGTDLDKRYQWYKETIDAAYDTYGVEFTYLSPSQNEVHNSYIDEELAWTIEFAKRLEADAEAPDARYDYSEIKIVALDSYRNGETVAGAILASPDALQYVDTIAVHYTIGGGPNLTRLNKEFGKEILYSEGVAPMIEPEYRIAADPARGGIGGTVGAVDIADRFINAYRWSGSGNNPAHMTSFLFQPAVSAMYEGSQYSPKNLIRASDPWSGYYEGGVGIALVRHFMQFIDEGWEYIENASYGDGPFADGGTAVDASTKTYLTLRTPASQGLDDAQVTQVHANNTNKPRYFEVKVSRLGTDADTPLYVWQTTGPEQGEAVDADWFQNPGYVTPARTETVDGIERDVYRVEVAPYSIMTLSTLPEGVHESATPYTSGEYSSPADDDILPLPYTDDFEYADYPVAAVNGTPMSYLERRGGKPRYTADQNGAFEVDASGDAGHGNVLVQKIHADNRGYTWNVWGNGSQNNVSTAAPATVLGDHRWTNYTASVDARFDTDVRDASLPNFVGLGVRQVVAQGSDLAPYAVRLFANGTWELRKLDTVVASGTVEGLDPTAWHRLSLTADENVFTVTLDGAALTTWTDASANTVMAGRVSLVSGYYNTQLDNLAIEPLKHRSWESVKIDDATNEITYAGDVVFNQVGYGHYNRTTHSLRTGASMTIPFVGSGFNLFGATGAATLEVSIDGGEPFQVTVGGTGDRRTSYWLRGLHRNKQHTLAVTVASGTFTLDGVDVVQGGKWGGPNAPVAVTGGVARAATTVGEAPDLPETVTAVTARGEATEAVVDWETTPESFATPYALVTVTGRLRDNQALTVQAPVEVVPANLVYMVDANGTDPRITSRNDVHATIRDHVQAAGGALLNEVPDQRWTAGAPWGAAVTGTAKAPLNQAVYDKTGDTGWYGDTISYRLTLPAGTYTVSSGHAEWWNPGSGRSRVIAARVSYTGADGAPITQTLGTATFPNGSLGQSRVLGGQITLTTPTEITFTAAKNGGTEVATLSWIGVAANS